jgi:acetylornithine deacetylase/succinyl-diaminopimelate desuccinylase-like protein
MDYDKSVAQTETDFTNSIIPGLCKYVEIDNLSPEYDPEWKTNGKLEKAANHLIEWAKNQGVKGLTAEMVQEKDRTPLVFIQVEPSSPDVKKNILLYGHFDKQPHMLPWNEGLDPLKPTMKGDYLYGRGASDDGYCTFTIVEAIKLIQLQGQKHGKINITIEGCEESGSVDLMYYLEKLNDRIGEIDMMVCMDSTCIDYNSLWITTSLRGVVTVDLTVECLQESVHSGTGSGIAPDSFTIIRELLDRVQDSKTHKVIDDLAVEIPSYRVDDAKKLAELIKEKVVSDKVKLSESVKPLSDDMCEVILNNTWRPTIVVVGMTGFPKAEIAGNVLRDKTTCRISLRLPPTFDGVKAGEIMKQKLTENPPYNSKITVRIGEYGNGFASGDLSEKLKVSFNKSSQKLFGKDYYCFGEGGSIPFMNSIQKKYPNCDLLVTGVLGPLSNAHCPNECLNVPYTKKITVALAHAICDYCS